MNTVPIESNLPNKNVGKKLILILAGSIASVYLLQYLLGFIFRVAGPNNEITKALFPFQNHYLSFAPYFITTEGMSGELTNDVTGAGRFFGGMIAPFVLLVVGSIVLYLIKPIRKYFNRIWMITFIALLLTVFVSASFIPPRKTIFDPKKKEVTTIKSSSLINSSSEVLKYARIEKLEFDFFKDYDGYSMQTIVYCQLYAVVEGKQVLLGENQVDSFGGKMNNWQATDEQKAAAQKVLIALNKLLTMPL